MSRRIDNFQINSSEVRLQPIGVYMLEIVADQVEVDDILDQLELSDITSHYVSGDLLDEIGMDEAIAHFGIEVKEEE